MEPVLIPSSARSWVQYDADTEFPIQNLPFGCVYAEDEEGETLLAPVTAIGEYAVSLWTLAEAGLLDIEIGDSYPWMKGLDTVRALRKQLYELFLADNPALRDNKELCEEALIPMETLEFALPMPVTAFVDFYSGINHASNVGKMFRPDQPPLLPNYKYLPIGYNGRSSTCIPTDSFIRRPSGLTKTGDEVSHGPTKELDFELELGYFLCEGTNRGEVKTAKECEQMIAGLVLVNDWSARDVQRFEYQPLGPFLAKSFATSVSPWLVTLDALAPFRVDGMPQDPKPFPHLADTEKGHFDIQLEVWLESKDMEAPQKICTSNTKYLYWSIFQQLAHQSSNGTELEAGDLYASGTISGETEDSFGSLLELTWKGTKPITLSETGETRTFLEDGDTVIMKAFAQGDGFRIGFGEVRGTVVS